MTPSERITCPFCSTINTRERETCLACGAPLPEIEKTLPYKSNIPNPVSQTAPSLPKTKDRLDKTNIDQDDFNELYTKGIYIYSLMWRTLAEILVISISGFCIGLAGGALGVSILGVLGALIYGATAGSVLKSFYKWMASMLLGIICGLIVAFVFHLFIPNAAVSLILLSTICVISVFIGSKRLPFARKNWWEKIRPLVGTLGGLAFGILGTTIGWGLTEIIKSFT